MLLSDFSLLYTKLSTMKTYKKFPFITNNIKGLQQVLASVVGNNLMPLLISEEFNNYASIPNNINTLSNKNTFWSYLIIP